MALRRPKVGKSQAEKSPLTPKKTTFVGLFKTGLSKMKDPWIWYAWVKGVFFGAIVVYLFLEGWPF
jgi:hypothetical protein